MECRYYVLQNFICVEVQACADQERFCPHVFQACFAWAEHFVRGTPWGAFCLLPRSFAGMRYPAWPARTSPLGASEAGRHCSRSAVYQVQK